MFKKEKQLVETSSRLPEFKYTYVLRTHTQDICTLRFSRSGFLGLSRCLVPTPGLTSEYPTCSVCVCVLIHTHTHTYTLIPRRVREDTDKHPYLLFCQK